MATNEPIKTVVIDRPGPTPAGELPPILVKMRPVMAILVRAARTGLQSFLGIVTAMMVTDLIPHDDFLDLCVKAASLSLAPVVLSLVQNSLELLQRIDESSPAWRA